MDTRQRSFALSGLLVLIASVVAMRLRTGSEEVGPPPPTRTERINRLRAERPLGDTVTGTVRDSQGRPLAGARVRWVGWDQGEVSALRSATTAADGSFAFPQARSLAEKGVALVADLPGYGLGLVQRRELGDGRFVEIVCGPPAQMRIPFITKAGEPVADMKVTVAMRIPSLGWFPLGDLGADATSDRAGVVSIGGLPYLGYVRVGVSTHSYAQPLFLNNVAVGQEKVRTLRPVVLYPAGRLIGRVLGPDGAPMVGVRIRAISTMSDLLARDMRVRTGPDGRFEIRGLSPRTYWIATDSTHDQAAKGWCAAYVEATISAGQTVDVGVLRPKRGVIVSGRCRDAVTGEPVPGVLIHVVSPDRTFATPEPITSSSIFLGARRSGGSAGGSSMEGPPPRPGTAVTNRPDGTFALCVPPGVWQLLPMKFDSATVPAGNFMPERPRLSLGPGDRKVIDFRFRRLPESRSGGDGLRAPVVPR